MREDDLVHQVRSALEALHDPAALEAHPLARALPPESISGMARSPGQRLRAMLIELIEGLRPQDEADDWTPASRRYVILYDRYVRRRSLQSVEARLCLGDRQVRREHVRAVQSLAALLAPRLGRVAIAGAGTGLAADTVDLQQAVQRLSPVPRSVAIAPLMVQVAEIVAHVAVGREFLPIQARVAPQDLRAHTDPGILHQLLVKLSRVALSHAEGMTPIELSATCAGDRARIRLSPCRTPILDGDAHWQLCQWLAQALHAALGTEDESGGVYSLVLTLPIGAQPRMVLVVDDEPLAIELFDSYLTNTDYQVIGETRAERAVERAIEVRPAVIILDVMMPGMDGWELLQRLHYTPALQDVPIVACSVLDDPDLAAALGAASFLKKPVLRQQLLATLAHVCRKSPLSESGHDEED